PTHLESVVPSAHAALEVEGLLVGQPGDRRQRLTHQEGGGGETNQIHPIGTFHRQQEPAPLLGRRRDHHGAGPGGDGGHPTTVQLPPHHVDLLASAAQHGDVGRSEPASLAVYFD